MISRSILCNMIILLFDNHHLMTANEEKGEVVNVSVMDTRGFICRDKTRGVTWQEVDLL